MSKNGVRFASFSDALRYALPSKFTTIEDDGLLAYPRPWRVALHEYLQNEVDARENEDGNMVELNDVYNLLLADDLDENGNDDVLLDSDREDPGNDNAVQRHIRNVLQLSDDEKILPVRSKSVVFLEILFL